MKMENHFMLTSTIARAAFAAALCALVATPSSAQSYPSRPVKLVVPYVPGGGVDFVGRLVAQKLTDAWGSSVIVDNRPGGGTKIGRAHV